jgi:hypothetical protein
MVDLLIAAFFSLKFFALAAEGSSLALALRRWRPSFPNPILAQQMQKTILKSEEEEGCFLGVPE